jgi:hypothetical protein
MTTIPDDPRHAYDDGPALAALRAEYPAWTIGYEAPLGIYSAELRQSDGAVRYLAGHTVGELRARLATATSIDAAARP